MTLNLDTPTPPAPKAKPMTEADVLAVLRQRHDATGNGGAGEHAYLMHVRNAAGFDANRTFDAVAVNLWPSRGLTIHVFEVKVSRSDWKRELAKPDKAEDACKVGDKFSIVAPVGVVKDGELPRTWGLIEIVGNGDDKPWKCREKVPAPLLRKGKPADRPIPRGLLVGLLRSCPGAIPGGRIPGPSQIALNAEYRRGCDDTKRDHERAVEARKRAGLDAYNDTMRMQQALIEAGLPRYEATPDWVARHATEIAALVKEAKAAQNFTAVRDHLRRVLEELDALDAE